MVLNRTTSENVIYRHCGPIFKRIMAEKACFVIVGGGIAGVTCVEQLSHLNSTERIVLLTASPLVKAVTNVKALTKIAETFDVEEKTVQDFAAEHPNIEVVNAKVTKLDAENRKIHTNDGKVYEYKKLCLCAGARPKVIATENPNVIGIRDTQTVKEFQLRLKSARRIVVVGNGGIATELANEIEGCQVVWAIKDHSIGATFFDAGAAQFFIPHLSGEKTREKRPLKRHKYAMDTEDVSETNQHRFLGSALGPDWSSGLEMKGAAREISHNVTVEYGCEVASVLSTEEMKSIKSTTTELETESEASTSSSKTWNVYVELSNGKIYGCDFVISATGVIPNSKEFCSDNNIEIAEDGAIKVNESMQTTDPNVYAAGDICTTNWEPATHWFQMRLWTQARQMGMYAAKCMNSHLLEDSIELDFCFEMFTHVTKFFGYKVILLGLYNAQGLGTNYNILLRVTKPLEYVKVIIRNGKMQGAVLIGETDLEETFENLILNQMDISVYGEDLLNPNIDIEDYFD